MIKREVYMEKIHFHSQHIDYVIHFWKKKTKFRYYNKFIFYFLNN